MSIPLYRDEEMPVLTLPPNWQSATTLSVRESTSILEALDQSEERWEHYPRPLYGIRFDATAADSKQQAKLRKQFELAEAKPFGVPLWTEAVELAEAAELGTESLAVGSLDGTLLNVFTYLLLWADVNTFEVLRYNAVGFSGSIPLAEPTTKAWPAGTKVIPLAWGYCKRPDFDSLGSDNSHISIEFEERILFSSTREREYGSPIHPTVDYSPCYDEITVSWGKLPAAYINIEIWHAADAAGPWLFWGETRRPATHVVLANYFKTRWVKIEAGTADSLLLLAKFKPLPPAVDPPEVEIYQRDSGASKLTRVPCGVANKSADYSGDRPTSSYATWPLPYGEAFSGIDRYIDGELAEDTARDQIAAVYTGNLIDPSSGVEAYRVNLFSEAFVQIEWRYAPDTTWHRSERFGKDVDVVATSQQAGVTIKWTLDGSDPTETNGFDSDSAVFPYPDPYVHSAFEPYIIARAFKDGCKSPPVYVPIDLTYHADAWCNPRQGHGHIRYECPQYHYDADCTLIPAGWSGIWSLDGGCPDYDQSSMRDEARLEAASGMNDMYPVQVIRSYSGENFPRFSCSNFDFETCYGPDPHTCPSDIWGGGAWLMDCDLHCVNLYRDDSFGWNYDADTFSSGIPDHAFILIGAKITITTESGLVPMELPTQKIPPRNQVFGLQSGDASDVPAQLKSTFLTWYPNAFVMPVNGEEDSLDDVRLTITCAFA